MTIPLTNFRMTAGSVRKRIANQRIGSIACILAAVVIPMAILARVEAAEVRPGNPSAVSPKTDLAMQVSGAASGTSGDLIVSDELAGRGKPQRGSQRAEGSKVGPGTLGDTEFSIRGRSTIELWQNREQYRPLVLKALRSSELETAERARWVVDRWRRGILADTDPSLSQSLALLMPVEAIELLLESADFASATIAMQESEGTLEFEAIANRVAMTLDLRFPVYARRAIQLERQMDLLRFLDLAATTKETVVCRRDWAAYVLGESGQELPLPNWDAWDPAKAAETKCLLHLLDGEYELAIAEAKRADELTKLEADGGTGLLGLASEVTPSRPNSLVRVVRMLQSDWQAMADESAVVAKQLRASRLSAENNSADADALPAWAKPESSVLGLRASELRHWSDVLIGASRAGDTELIELAVNGLAFEGVDDVNDLGDDGAGDGSAGELGEAERAEDNFDAEDSGGPSLNEKSGDAALPDDVQKLAWRTLLIHGYVDETLAWVGEIDPADAALIASSASRWNDAIRLVGFDAGLIDTQLESWIDDAVRRQRQLFDEMSSDDLDVASRATMRVPSGVDPKVESLFALVRLLLSVGRDDAAWRIADKLSQEGLSCKRGSRAGTYLVRDYVLLTLLMTNKTDWMFELAFRDWEEEPTLVSQSLVARLTIVEDYQVLMILSAMVNLHDPDISPRESFKIACELARAEVVDRQTHGDWIPILYQQLRDGTLRKAVASDPQLVAFLQPLNRVWSDLFLAYGRRDLAEPILRSLAATGNVESILALAQDYRLSDRSASDESLDAAYETIWQIVSSPQSDVDSRYTDDVSSGVVAVAGQVRLARDRGDTNTAGRLLDDLRAMACTPSTDLRQSIADLLADLGQWEDAHSIYQSLLMMTAINSDETQSLLDITRSYQRFASEATKHEVEHTESAIETRAAEEVGKYERDLRRDAIHWFDLAFAGTLASFDYRARLYLVYPQMIARERLEVALAERAAGMQIGEKVPSADQAQGAGNGSDQDAAKLDQDAAKPIVKLVEQLQRFDSMDITTGESIMPELRRLGLGKIADLFLADVQQAATDHLARFPTDAMTANNVAWSAAVNDFKLPEILELSRKAVRMEPDSAIYRDTLAEILARMGQKDQALLIEKGCVLDDPGQWHLHEQINRFQNHPKQR
ncbi:O-linked GlcNAc transferase [Neorhodopirellula lusitana]|uniref:O-linked GlcNAc transferase n=1 Tax=Neorhodopirellula lusitana TaxID=445327 RepID=UPI00384AFD2A